MTITFSVVFEHSAFSEREDGVGGELRFHYTARFGNLQSGCGRPLTAWQR